MLHELKIEESYYNAVEQGDKTCEIRKDDRKFKRFDCLILKCVNNKGEYLNRKDIRVIITHISIYLQKKGIVVLSFKKLGSVEKDLALKKQMMCFSYGYINGIMNGGYSTFEDYEIKKKYRESLMAILDEEEKFHLNDLDKNITERLRKLKASEN